MNERSYYVSSVISVVWMMAQCRIGVRILGERGCVKAFRNSAIFLRQSFHSTTPLGLNRFLFGPDEIQPVNATQSSIPTVLLPKDDYRTIHAASTLKLENGDAIRAGIVGCEQSAGQFTDLRLYGKAIKAMGTYGQGVWLSGFLDQEKPLETKEGTLTVRGVTGFVAMSQGGELLWGVDSGPKVPQARIDAKGAMFLFHRANEKELNLGQATVKLPFVNDNFVAKFVQP